MLILGLRSLCYGQTPLHLAAWYGKDDAADWLLSNKAEVNATDTGGETPLHRNHTSSLPLVVIPWAFFLTGRL